MALTWPLAMPFDNIVFGETSLGLGMLDLALALYQWKKGATLNQKGVVPVNMFSKELTPFRTILIGLGLGIIAIAFAAYKYRFFIAPKEEPIGGYFGLQYPTGENVFISSMFLCVGISALLSAQFLADFSKDQTTVKFRHIAN